MTIQQDEARRYRCEKCKRDEVSPPLDLGKAIEELRSESKHLLRSSWRLQREAEDWEEKGRNAGAGPFSDTCGPCWSAMWDSRDQARRKFDRAHLLITLADRLQEELLIFAELDRRDAFVEAILDQLTTDRKGGVAAA